MRERGYPKEISAGTIAAGGTLGILIPPCYYNDCITEFLQRLRLVNCLWQESFQVLMLDWFVYGLGNF